MTRRGTHKRTGFITAGLAATLALAACDGGAENGSAAIAQAEAFNMRLVGHHDLQGRWSYQPILHKYGERTILFVGHHAGKAVNPDSGEEEVNGLSILDVSDPANPVLLRHVPPTGEADGTQHVQVCDGSVLPKGDPGKVYALRTNGQISHEILDVTDPAAPLFLNTIFTTGRTVGGRRNTHKSQWDCATGTGYLTGTVEGWRAPRVLQAWDLADPARPVHIRNFGIDGMQPGAGEGDWTIRKGLHQPVIVGNRMYLGYESGSHGVLQILDRDKFMAGDPAVEDRFAPTPENLAYPQIARLDLPSYWGVHTAKPVYGMDIADYGDNRDAARRDILIVASESLAARCQEARHAVFFVDITEEATPVIISSYQVPESSGDFCARGGRFGPHSFHDSYNPDFLKKLMLVSYFNAGVRAVDIRDPFAPREVGYFIPQVTGNTDPTCVEIDGAEECRTAVQTNNINIDDRGYVYLLDRRGTGLHIVELTGEARDIVGLE